MGLGRQDYAWSGAAGAHCPDTGCWHACRPCVHTAACPGHRQRDAQAPSACVLSAALCSSAAGGQPTAQFLAQPLLPGSPWPRRAWWPGGPTAVPGLPGGRAEPHVSRYRCRGWGWGRGRRAIHLLLLQRNGAARAPAHLSSASFADNGHLSSLSSAPMSSARLTAAGLGGGGGGVGESAHSHVPAGPVLLLGHTCPQHPRGQVWWAHPQVSLNHQAHGPH